MIVTKTNENNHSISSSNIITVAVAQWVSMSDDQIETNWWPLASKFWQNFSVPGQ